MFQNYLKTAFRNLLRNKLFSAINIVGLAVGLSAFILIVLFVRDQFSWETSWQNADNIYRIENTYLRPGSPERASSNAVDPLKDIFLDTFREVEDITRYFPANLTIRVGSELQTQQTMFADSNFFQFFNVEFIEGNAATALSELGNVVLSERTAKRLFGDGTALGKSVVVRRRSGDVELIVSGVIADPAQNTQIQHDFVTPFNREYFVGARWFTEDWQFALRRTFVRLQEGVDPSVMAAEFPALVERHLPKSQAGMETGRNWSVRIDMVPLQDMRLYGNNANANPDVLFGMLGIAFLILIIAVVNYLNLSMARTAHRAREVAIRKVVGASGGQITQQFLGEALILAFIALLLAMTIAELALPAFNEFLASVVSLDLTSEPATLAVLVVLAIGVGLSAGSFQAVFFAALKPRDVLYSSTASDNGTSKLRSALVVTQFTISIGLMIVTFFVNKQTEYARSLELGFNPDNLLVVAGTNNDRSDEFKFRLLESPLIQSVGRSSDVPTEGSEDRLLIQPAVGAEKVTLDGLPADPDFFTAYDIPLLAGRFLNATEADALRLRSGNTEYKTAGNIIVNRSGAKLLGYETPEAAVGQIVTADMSADLRIDARIVGVVENFHFDSARDVIRPGIYYHDEQRRSDMSVRIDGTNRELAIQAIREAWFETYPDSLFRFRVMADMVEQQYQTDNRLSDLLLAFTMLAIAISCMGLYGLASFTAERRTKEIGIRKVLGAGIKDIVSLLIWQFSKPILIANLIAWPAAFYFVSDWLGSFAYRVELGVLPFVGVGLAALLIGWATVAARAFVVAQSNPIKALRYE
jgi:putative ABC transport system permease protein